ncbi:hypothetical protein [Streptomyces sp. NPDC001415]
MSEPESIVPSGIPQFTGDLDSLDHDTALLNAQAGAFRDAGAGIHAHFQGAAAFYKAPEAEQLFATTAPVATKTATFAGQLEKVSGALSAYSQEVRPLAKKLEDLQRQAYAFTVSIAGDEHWRRDETKRDRNDALKHEVQATLEAFYAAEITCHNKITALVGGTTLVLGKLSGGQMLPKGTSAYGAGAADLDHLENAPWGTYAAPEYTGLSWLYHQGKSFVWDGFIVDGIWGTVQGIDTLLGADGWDKAGEAWWGLAKVATGLAIAVAPGAGAFYMAAPDSTMPTWFRESRTALKETGKALIAYDEWGKNPSRAAGGVAFNVLTTVFTAGAGTAVKGGAVAKTVSVLGKVGRVVDPMTYVFSAGKFGVGKVGDLFATLKTLNSGAYNDILSGTGHLQPDGTYAKFADGVPVVKGDVIEWPNGSRLNLKENTVTLADGTKTAAHIELSAAERAFLAHNLPRHEPAMAGAQPGEHAADHSTATQTGAPRNAEHLPDGATNGFRNEGSSETSQASRPSGPSNGAHIPEHAAQPGGQHPDHGVPPEASVAHPGSHSPSPTEYSGDQHQHAEGRSGGGPSHDVPSGDISPPPPGPGTKLLAQLDQTRTGVTNHLITEVDGRPVADYLDDLARDRAAAYRAAKEAGSFPRKQTGACVGAVIDLRTGQIFEGINGKADDIIPQDELHPTLAARYESIGDPPPHKDHPLGHAEVKAVNELLKQRTKLGLPDGESVLAELRASVEFPYLPNKETGLTGRAAPFCANCNHMLQGVPSSHGRFTGFPPSEENWIP